MTQKALDGMVAEARYGSHFGTTTVTCMGLCRTPRGRRRRTSHDLREVFVREERWIETRCSVCHDVSTMDPHGKVWRFLRAGSVVAPPSSLCH
jgi:hypothetical protein